MTTEIKEYLKEMEKNNKKISFIFYKFYLKPSEVLGGCEEETLNKYYLYGNIIPGHVEMLIMIFLKFCSYV